MNWRDVLREAAAAADLDEAALARRVQDLAGTAPSMAAAIGRLARASRLATGFMATSAGDGADEPRASLPPGSQLGAWRIEALIGAGGMGEVYRAARADGRYEQTAALKVMARQLAPSRARGFEQERRRLARLNHPSVNRIIDGGETADDRPFMVMELVDGATIDAYCAERGLNRAQRLGLVHALCGAVAHAHGRLVLHRDIKASNVLVGDEGGVKLIDFGIASLLDEEAPGGIGPLTLATAAPEQLAGEPATVQTDVFAIGVLAHQLAAGGLPARRADGGVALDERGLGERDLVAIVARATALAPERRYPTVEALADDILALLERRPVAARGGGFGYRAAKLAQRYPLASASVGLAALALIGGLAASLAMAYLAERARDRAEHLLTRAERAASIAATYAGFLDDAYRSEEDAARLKDLLAERAGTAFARRNDNPKRAAEITLVAARHFLAGGDLAAAAATLEPWLEAGFGDPDLLRGGKLLLAIAYSHAGEREKALALFDEIEPLFRSPHERLTVERVQLMTERAVLSGDPTRIYEARALVEEALAQADEHELVLTYTHFLQLFANSLGDHALGYRAAKRTFEAYKDDGLTEMHGWGAAAVQLAAYELYHREAPEEAAKLVKAILDRGEGFSGPENTSAALKLTAQMAMDQRDWAEAEAALRRARALDVTTLGNDHLGWAMFVELLAARNELDRAEKELDALVQADRERRGAKTLPARFVLTLAYLRAVKDGPKAGTEVLLEGKMTRRYASRTLVWSFLLRRLEAMGVTPPEDKS